jgi:IS5 family transposase
MPESTRRVSLFDGDTREPTQRFGQVTDNPDDRVGLRTRSGPAIERIIAAVGATPDAVTADRGYGLASVDTQLEDLGVDLVAIPRKGQPGTARRDAQSEDRFVELVKWRTGSEGRIATLKRQHGWERARNRGLEGARIWCGWGVLSHNLVKIAGLTH